MVRSPDVVRAERLNAAVALLEQRPSLSEAAATLATQYGLSKRQAYRYLTEAHHYPTPVPMPERKVAFTVKLPVGLVQRVRQRARASGQRLSDLVAQALEAWVGKGRAGGR